MAVTWEMTPFAEGKAYKRLSSSEHHAPSSPSLMSVLSGKMSLRPWAARFAVGFPRPQHYVLPFLAAVKNLGCFSSAYKHSRLYAIVEKNGPPRQASRCVRNPGGTEGERFSFPLSLSFVSDGHGKTSRSRMRDTVQASEQEQPTSHAHTDIFIKPVVSTYE